MIRQASHCTWAQYNEMDRDKTWFVLPIGAMEQHGRHLPVGTDQMILQLVLDGYEKKKAEENILLLAPLPFGSSMEHMDFPGTVSVSVSLLAALVKDVAKSIRTHGFHKLIVLSSHGGNTSLLGSCAKEINRELDIAIYNIDFWTSHFIGGAQAYIDSEVKTDMHAGEIETSILLHRYAHLVDQSRAVDCAVPLHKFNNNWRTVDLSESGVLGSPVNATAAKGGKLLTYMVDRLEQEVRDIIAYHEELAGKKR